MAWSPVGGSGLQEVIDYETYDVIPESVHWWTDDLRYDFKVMELEPGWKK